MANEKLKIRDARLSEVNKIYSGILKKSGREAYNKELIEDLINDKLSICLVAELNKKIIGTLGSRREGYKAYWIYFFHVKGKKTETEKLLIEEFFKIVKKLKANKIASDTPESELLRKFKFKEVGRIPGWQKNNKDQVIMFRSLK